MNNLQRIESQKINKFSLPASHIPQMYTEVELICLFAQNHPLENGPTFRLLPF
jgi:hypothetical protein